MVQSTYIPTAGLTQQQLTTNILPQNSSDKAYSDGDDEESKQFEARKQQLEKHGFDGSDNEAYSEEPDDEQEEDDDNDNDFEVTSQDSEERDRAFYGDEYTLLS